MRIIFMGTPDFAVGTLEALCKSQHEVVAVVTQPDKPKGRGKTLAYPPVKEKALEYGLCVYQPKKVREPEVLEILREKKPDVIVVAAFGQIIPKSILELPEYGCLNVHASLLPKYRGAAPIQWAIIDGEKETGVTIMQMDEGLDTGDMIDKVIVPIEKEETGGTLFDKLSVAGAELLVATLTKLETGETVCEKQPQESTTEYAKMIRKDMGFLDFNQPAVVLERLVRGMNPWPSAFTYLNKKTLKVWKAVVKEGCLGEIATIVGNDGASLDIQTKDGILSILELQLEGKKRMESSAFLRGYTVEKGTKLGEK